MTSKTQNWEEQLLTLRALTATTGVIHEAQVLQLKMWGGVAFAAYGKWEANLDGDSKTVTYTLTRKKPLPKKNAAPAIAALDRSIHWLLGDDWGLKVKQSSKLIYDGPRVSTNVNEKRKQRRSNRAG